MWVIDARSFDIPSDENDYDELVAFADTIANAHEFEAIPIGVLDKIRSEIEELDYITFDGITKRRCLEIIEKYKAESEKA